MPPDIPMVKDELPLFEDYLNSAFPCDDLFFNAKVPDTDGSPLLRTYSEDREATSSPASSHSSSSKDDSMNEADSDVSLAIKRSNNTSETAVHKKSKDVDVPREHVAPLRTVVLEPKVKQESTSRPLQESADHVSTETLNYQLNLHGIPPKSRVETQIRLGIQVVRVITENQSVREMAIGDRFKWLKLPSWAMAKEKLKLQNRRDAPATIDPNRIIFLDARVVKSTEPLEDVTICAGCVTRERKRAQRKKDPPKRLSSGNEADNPPAAEPLELLPLPDENRKILVFNCPELLEITNGEVVIPTRVTCYCRHHKEKDGFRIIITLRDALNNILASTSSELVLITDDHKTTGKVQRVKDQTINPVKGQPYNVSAQSGTNVEGKMLVDTCNTAMPQMQTSTLKPLSRRSSVSSTATTSKKRKAEAHIHHHHSHHQQPQLATNAKLQKLPNSLSMTNISQQDGSTPLAGSKGNSRVTSPAASNRHVERSPSQDSLFNFMNQTAEQNATGSHMPSPMPSTSIANSISSPEHGFFDTSMDELMHERNISMSPRTRTWDYIMDTASNPQSSPMNRQTSIIMPPTAPHQSTSSTPVISRMIPVEGPLQGGMEVTILGNGFYPGMTAMFGEAAAVPTHCWSPTTLVCVLPPATNAGPVPVTFKEHPYSIGTKMFTYMDETDRALYELALQVIGLKTTGRLETARDVAMRICSSKMPSESVDTNMNDMPIHRLRSALGMSEESPDTEELVRRCLQYLATIENDRPVRLSQRTKSGHTLLHLAVIQNYYGLVSDLLLSGSNVNIRDRASFTALHTAALCGDVTMCRLLLAYGNSNISMCTCDGRTAYDIAMMHDDDDLLAILDPWTRHTRSQAIQSVRSTRSNSQTSYYNDSDTTTSPTSEISQISLEARFADSLQLASDPWDNRSVSSRASGTRTQPASRASSPNRSFEARIGERKRSRSVNNLMLSELSKDEIQSLATSSKVVSATEDATTTVDAQTVMHNLLQIQQTWMAFLAETSPLWLQKTLANANASLPELLKTKPNNLVQNMHLASSPIAAFHAMLPHMPQIRPLSRSQSHETRKGQAKPTAAADPGWLQNLVSSLGAPPSYDEAISSNTADTVETAHPEASREMTNSSRADARAAATAQTPQMFQAIDDNGWFGKSLAMPFRSQGRIAEMTPEQQRAQVRRFKKPADKMMFFFWLPCLLFFIAISIGKAFVDKVIEFVQ